MASKLTHKNIETCEQVLKLLAVTGARIVTSCCGNYLEVPGRGRGIRLDFPLFDALKDAKQIKKAPRIPNQTPTWILR